MKCIFLDIDGVLNSAAFYKGKTDRQLLEEPFDPACAELLQRIIECTGAVIVLTSSWRGGWNKDPALCSLEGRLLNQLMASFGLSIHDKTACLPEGGRSEEIRHFMKTGGLDISEYVIIDDNDFGWKEAGLQRHVVQTDFLAGGLTEEHALQAIEILNRKSFLSLLRAFFRF